MLKTVKGAYQESPLRKIVEIADLLLEMSRYYFRVDIFYFVF